MKRQGPHIEALTRRLAECPDEMLALPRVGRSGVVHVDAVVSDLLVRLGRAPLTASEADVFAPSARAGGSRTSTKGRKTRNRLSVTLLSAWLLHDDWFRERELGDQAHQLLSAELAELAALVKAPQIVSDAERREELARLVLARLELRPAGESKAEAADRLTTLSSAERQRVIREAQAAERRAREVREALRKKAAEEAAARYNPE